MQPYLTDAAVCVCTILSPLQVRAQVLETIASDPGLQQTELVFLGLFGRACRALAAGGGSTAEAAAEAATLIDLLEVRTAEATSTLYASSAVVLHC